jgi:small subunit ribosomal protein S30e
MPTHGSLTKAGKVRNQTPTIAPQDGKKSTGPRRRNRRKYQRLLSGKRDDKRRRRRGR